MFPFLPPCCGGGDGGEKKEKRGKGKGKRKGKEKKGKDKKEKKEKKKKKNHQFSILLIFLIIQRRTLRIPPHFLLLQFQKVITNHAGNRGITGSIKTVSPIRTSGFSLFFYGRVGGGGGVRKGGEKGGEGKKEGGGGGRGEKREGNKLSAILFCLFFNLFLWVWEKALSS